jgi:hypothetical protein
MKLAGRIFVLALAVCMSMTARSAFGQSGGSRGLVSGWNLVAIPPGTSFSVTPLSMLTLPASGGDYVPLASPDKAVTGQGYWVLLDKPSVMKMPAPLHDGVSAQFQAPPGQWILLGDTTSFYPGFVSGADAVFIYDPETGYQSQKVLFPGQGAMAMSESGGTITIGSGSPSGPPPP